MDVFDHVVYGGALDERVRFAGLAPMEELSYKVGHFLCWRAPMHDNAVAAYDGYANRAERARLIDERVRHLRVGFEQVIDRPRVIQGHGVVRKPRVLHLLDVLGWTQDGCAVDHVGDLAQGEAVTLDGGRGMDGEDAAEPAQAHYVAGAFLAHPDALEQGVYVPDLPVPGRVFRVKLFKRRHGRSSGVGEGKAATEDLFIGITHWTDHLHDKRPFLIRDVIFFSELVVRPHLRPILLRHPLISCAWQVLSDLSK